jgi:alkylmercury lyase
MTRAFDNEEAHMTATADLRRAAEEARLSFTSQAQEKLPPKARAFHRVILRAFLDIGAGPALGWLYDQAGRLGLDPDAALGKLAEADLVHLDNGSVVVAYPFSGVPTNDRVQLNGGPAVYAMCAIDALGIVLMTGRDGVISSTDPQTGAPIRVARHGSDWEWSPTSTVVVAGLAPACSTAAEVCCPHVAFYASAERADAYLQTHPELRGAVLDHADALEMANLAFGSLLRRSESEPES